MPSRKKERKMRCEKNTYILKKSTYRRKKDWSYRNNVNNRQLNDLNKIIYNHKSKQSWRVVPKDSLEVHKDRRKRQIEDQRRKEKNKYDENVEDERRDDDSKTKRTSRRRRRQNSRRSDSESSSSCSTLSCCTSCANAMDYE